MRHPRVLLGSLAALCLAAAGAPAGAAAAVFPPDTTITSGPTGTVPSGSATFQFTASQIGARLECRLDSPPAPAPAGPWQACTSPKTYTGLADGPHLFEARAVNFIGEPDETPASRAWSVDTTPPETTLTSGPSGTVSSSTATFGFTSPDATASFECRLDGAAPAPCTSPRSYSGLGNGGHTFEVTAIDPVGNRDQTPASRGWTISGGAPPPPPPPPPPPGDVRLEPSRVFIILMENKEYHQVIGSRTAPYMTRLAERFGNAKRFYGIRHPSLPNYLALIGGSTFGVSTNCTGCSFSGPTLVDQMERKGLSWRAYMDGMPRSCFLRAKHGRYVKRHNPFVYFRSITRSRTSCRRVVPGSRLNTALRRDRLARFNWITPDVCKDTHDCGVGIGDRYLANLVPRLLRHTGPDGFVVITYDEGTTNAGCCGRARGGRIPTVLAGPDVKREFADSKRRDLYSLLATFDDLWGLARLRKADGRTPNMGPYFIPPGRPGLAGSAIQPVGNFSISWSAPVKGLEARKLHLRLCDTATSQCSTSVRRMRPGQRRLTGLRAPLPGSYTARIWLEDPFGNIAAANGSNTLQLVLQGT